MRLSPGPLRASQENRLHLCLQMDDKRFRTSEELNSQVDRQLGG
jgi:hypothetical protein